jgi:DNA-binding transcriptional LysR family regulator
VILTPAGERFLRDARELCEGLSRAKTAAQQIAHGIGVPYSFGYLESAAIDILGKALIDFRARRPNAQLELHELHTTDQVRMLRNHQLDMGLLRYTALAEPGLEFDEAYEDELVLLLAYDHWVKGETVRLADLANEQFTVYDRKLGSGMFNATLEATTAAGFMPIHQPASHQYADAVQHRRSGGGRSSRCRTNSTDGPPGNSNRANRRRTCKLQGSTRLARRRRQ